MLKQLQTKKYNDIDINQCGIVNLVKEQYNSASITGPPWKTLR